MIIMKTRILALSIAIVVLSFPGCKDPKLTGTVKFTDGTPLTTGMVVLQNDKSQGIGELKEDGSFDLYQFKPGDGLKPGVYKGYISNAVLVDEGGKTQYLIAPKYSNMDDSGIIYDTKTNKGRLDIVVEKP